MNIWDLMNDHTATISDRVALSRRQSLLQVMSTKIIETNVIDAEAINPEDLEPRSIELDGNLATDPYQIHERFVRSSLTEDMMKLEKLVPMCLTSGHRCIPNTIQRKAVQTRVLKMENYEKCWLHYCICIIEKIVNPLECHLHRRNLLHCYRKEKQVQSVLKLIQEKA